MITEITEILTGTTTGDDETTGETSKEPTTEETTEPTTEPTIEPSKTFDDYNDSDKIAVMYTFIQFLPNFVDRDDFSSPRVYYEENRKKGSDSMTSPFQKT